MKILVVEDDKIMQDILKVVFANTDCVVVDNYADAELALSQNVFAAAFLDIQLQGDPKKDGVLLLKNIQKLDHYLPCIMISGIDDPDVVSLCLQLGAVDYIAKGTVNPEAYRLAFIKAQSWRKMRAENPVERVTDGQSKDQFGLLGHSPLAQSLRDQVESLASMPGPFLIQGETGTGKEVVARALWRLNDKKMRPFIAVNCASLPESLVESELFGYERGAFTGALQAKAGLFEAAAGGDIFLDEIGDLSVDLQAKLLRVLQEKRVRRLGSDKERPVDFRVIAATHVQLQEAIAKKEFREDIFYRLNVYPIYVPPLRERLEDVAVLLEEFVFELSGQKIKLSSVEAETLMQFSWPGNIRQLKALAYYLLPPLRSSKWTQMDTQKRMNLLVKWIEGQTLGGLNKAASESLNSAACDSSDLSVFDPGPAVRRAAAQKKNLGIVEMIDDLQKRYVVEALKETQNNRSQAAKILGISRQRLTNWLAEWGIY